MNHEFELQAEAFRQEMNREYYLAEAGLKEHLEITPIYERYAHLFDERLVREFLASADDRQGQYITEWVTLEYLENLVKGLTEQVANEMRRATVEWDGQQVSYRDLRALMANETDLLRRHQLDQLERETTVTANEERAARLRSLQDKARELGFESYVALCDRLRDLGLGALTRQMQALLDSTREVFFRQLTLYLRDMHVPVKEARTCDIIAFFRGTRFDTLFPSASMMSTLTSTLLGLGIDVAKQENLEVDTEARALKTPRAFCAPIRIPEEVKLVTKPIGGPDDFASLLHEAGHAEHFVHVDPGLPFPYKRLGDNSITESYAFLFQHLLLNHDWLRRLLGIRESAEYLRFESFRKLWLVRRYASKLLYEQKLHTQPEGAEREYVSILGGALGVAIAAEHYLADTDDAFYCAQYLRAWILEGQLRHWLEEQFGHEWFVAKGAGQFLASLWKRGQELRAEELAREMGYDGLQPEYLMAELVEHGED